jgi:Spy/CpxP family protein refolding chaperone
LNAATEKLAGTLRQSHVDSTKAQAELDAVLDLEREIKHAQLTLMIQIKNQLTAEQQATARKFAHEAGAK